MSSSSSRVDPHDVLKAKVFPQRCINYLDGHSDERPAFVTDIGFLTTCTYLVIVGQVNVEDQLFCRWTKRCRLAKSFSIAGIRGVYRTYFKARRVQAEDVFPKSMRLECLKPTRKLYLCLQVSSGEALVSQISIVL